jgi:hypothetical protein
MSCLTKLTLAAVLVGCSSPNVEGQSNNDLKTTVIAGKQMDAPLQIVGFKFPTKFGDPPRVAVQNKTSKQVTGFLIDAVVGRSDSHEGEYPKRGEAAAIQSGTDDSSWSEERTIPPYGTVEIHDRVFGSLIVGHLAKQVGSTCLRVVAVVTRVEFADGSVWSVAQPPWQSWKDSLPEGTRSCPQAREIEDVLRRLEGSGPKESIGLPTQLDQEQHESYSFSCSVQEVKGKLRAFCPF